MAQLINGKRGFMSPVSQNSIMMQVPGNVILACLHLCMFVCVNNGRGVCVWFLHFGCVELRREKEDRNLYLGIKGILCIFVQHCKLDTFILGVSCQTLLHSEASGISQIVFSDP